MPTSHNRNPEGRNQFGPVLKANDKRLQEALQEYHRQRITNCNRISELLLADHGIEMKPRTIRKRRAELQLLSSRAMMKQMTTEEAEEIVLDAVNKDSAGKQGVRNITREIAAETGIHIARQFVSDVMHRHFPEGFARRDCTLKENQRKKRGKVTALRACGIPTTNSPPKIPNRSSIFYSTDGHS